MVPDLSSPILTSAANKELFNSVLQPDQIASEPAELAYYGKDAGHHFDANASLVIFPKSTAEVQACLKIAHANKISIVPSGGRTGYCGGATATNGEVILSLKRMNKVLEVSVADATVRVQAGATLERVQQAASEADLYYPVDFTARGSAQIGGTIATNAGGIRVIRYGMTREWVLGLQIVTANGDILEVNRSLYKNNSGYDLVQLMCGSEGTLGIITEATLKLTTPPEKQTLVCLALEDESQIVPILERVRKAHYTVTLFEFMDTTSMSVVLEHHAIPKPFQQMPSAALLLEVDCAGAESEAFNEFLMKLLEDGLVNDVVLAENGQQKSHLMQLREFIGDVLNKKFTVHKQDISVAPSLIPQCLTSLRQIFAQHPSQYRTAMFGHVGDGNIHINVIKPEQEDKTAFFLTCRSIDETIFALLSSINGSISAEHGVGLLKKKYLHFCRSAEELAMMRAIKYSLDPQAILNPDKIVDVKSVAV